MLPGQELKRHELDVKKKSMRAKKAAPKHETGVLNMMDFDEIEAIELQGDPTIAPKPPANLGSSAVLVRIPTAA